MLTVASFVALHFAYFVVRQIKLYSFSMSLLLSLTSNKFMVKKKNRNERFLFIKLLTSIIDKCVYDYIKAGQVLAPQYSFRNKILYNSFFFAFNYFK